MSECIPETPTVKSQLPENLDQIKADVEAFAARPGEQSTAAPVYVVAREVPDLDVPELPARARLPEGAGADASPWLDSYIEMSRKSSPRSYDGFHETAGLWLLSVIAARRVKLQLGAKIFITALYLLLAAKTTIHAKSSAAELATKVLHAIGLDWLLAPEDATPQKFILNLANKMPANYFGLPDGEQNRLKLRKQRAGQCGWFYDEFGQMIDSIMRENGTHGAYKGILRRFDDGKELYRSDTVTRDLDTVVEPYLALMASITPSDIARVAKRGSSFWGDGFFARFAIVTPPPGAQRNRERFPDEPNWFVPHAITDPLVRWNQRLGFPGVHVSSSGNDVPDLKVDAFEPHACSISSEALDGFYNYFDAMQDLIESDALPGDLEGNYGRLADKAIRVAILLASLENENKIELRHWARGQEIAERWRVGLHAIYAAVNHGTADEERALESRALRAIRKSGGGKTVRELSQSLGIDLAKATDLASQMAEAGLLKADEVRKYRGIPVYRYDIA